ncbi:MAG: hypothetical protein JWQ85_1544 [Mucilaginibacter sp.]|nr:hypothetical protein [Mucilaginibacter sp.]
MIYLYIQNKKPYKYGFYIFFDDGIMYLLYKKAVRRVVKSSQLI